MNKGRLSLQIRLQWHLGLRDNGLNKLASALQQQFRRGPLHLSNPHVLPTPPPPKNQHDLEWTRINGHFMRLFLALDIPFRFVRGFDNR